jgi:hypothetical protein
MAEQGDVSFAEALSFLFDKCAREDGKPYSDRDVAQALKDDGVDISYSYVWLLRQGKKDDPRASHIRGFARFFGVPSGFFLDREVHARWVERIERSKEPAVPAQQRRGQAVLLRNFAGMSARSTSLIEALAAHVIELESEDDAAAHD